MKFTGEDEDPLPIDLEAVVIPLNDFVKAVIMERPLCHFLGFGSCKNAQKRKEYAETGNQPSKVPHLEAIRTAAEELRCEGMLEALRAPVLIYTALTDSASFPGVAAETEHRKLESLGTLA